MGVWREGEYSPEGGAGNVTITIRVWLSVDINLFLVCILKENWRGIMALH